jgi:hypothetical protein
MQERREKKKEEKRKRKGIHNRGNRQRGIDKGE